MKQLNTKKQLRELFYILKNKEVIKNEKLKCSLFQSIFFQVCFGWNLFSGLEINLIKCVVSV